MVFVPPRLVLLYQAGKAGRQTGSSVETTASDNRFLSCREEVCCLLLVEVFDRLIDYTSHLIASHQIIKAKKVWTFGEKTSLSLAIGVGALAHMYVPGGSPLVAVSFVII